MRQLDHYHFRFRLWLICQLSEWFNLCHADLIGEGHGSWWRMLAAIPEARREVSGCKLDAGAGGEGGACYCGRFVCQNGEVREWTA